jgi:hypothetical protein
MIRAARTLLLTILCALAVAPAADAAGGDYVFANGTPAQQRQVRAALDASAFDWSLVPEQVTIHVARGGSYSLPGHVWLDAALLDSGAFSWATVQDEYAHQLDFFLFDDATRTQLTAQLGGKAWCHEVQGLRHDQYGCERFSSTLVWAYWPSSANAYRPSSARDESAAMAPAAFRSLMSRLIGAPTNVSRALTSAARR